MQTVANTILIGKIGTGTSANYNSKQALFSPALASPLSPVTIQMATDALQWGEDNEIGDATSQRLIANYIIWLCGRFGLTARNILNTGGNVTTINPISLRPSRMDFIVTGASFFPTGSTGGVITNFIGYNIDFIRGGLSQSQITTESSYITWDRITGILLISPALQATEIISIIPS